MPSQAVLECDPDSFRKARSRSWPAQLLGRLNLSTKQSQQSQSQQSQRRVMCCGQPYFPDAMVERGDLSSVVAVASLFWDGAGADERSIEEAVVTVVEGGITNALYRVAFDSQKNNSVVLLVRVFGGEGLIDRDVETACYAALCDAGVAPGYYGRFGNGRVERWMDGYRTLTVDDLSDPKNAHALANSLSELHRHFRPRRYRGLRPHFPDRPNVWETLVQWHARSLQLTHTTTNNNTTDTTNPSPFREGEAAAARARTLLEGSTEELERVRHNVPPNCELVFCHNDLLAANVMVGPRDHNNDNNNNHDTPTIQLIDFEYGSINYAALDIANHFNEYAGGTDNGKPCYDKFPSETHQRTFLQTYLHHRNHGDDQDNHNNDSNKNNITLDEFHAQVRAFVLVNHWYWGLWAINQAAVEGCQHFDYLLYAENRIKQYYKLKPTMSPSPSST